jgi:hypothetical protein
VRLEKVGALNTLNFFFVVKIVAKQTNAVAAHSHHVSLEGFVQKVISCGTPAMNIATAHRYRHFLDFIASSDLSVKR